MLFNSYLAVTADVVGDVENAACHCADRIPGHKRVWQDGWQKSGLGRRQLLPEFAFRKRHATAAATATAIDDVDATAAGLDVVVKQLIVEFIVDL